MEASSTTRRRPQGSDEKGNLFPLGWTAPRDGRARCARSDAVADRSGFDRESLRGGYACMKPYVDRGGIEREREEQAEQLLQAVCRAHQEGRLQAVIQELEQEREHGSSWPDEAILTEDTLRLAQHLRAGLMAETWPLFDAHHPDKIALDPSEKRNACGAAARARGAAYCVWHLKALFVGLLLECQAVENKWLAARNQGASENDAPTVCGMFVDGKASVVW